MITFVLPDLGEGLREAEIVTWHVSVGDHVVTDQPLLSVETDKAVVEIPSPYKGRVEKLHVAPGDVVPTGAPLVDLESGDKVTDGGTVVGELRTAASRSAHAAAAGAIAQGGDAVKAVPAVRALAATLDVDLRGLHGSGPGGTVTRADVEDAAARAISDSAPVEPLRGVRRAMSRKMSDAHAQVVPASLTEVADIHDWPDDADIMLRLVDAICAACRQEPALNAWYLGMDEGRRLNEQVHLGIAMDTPDGLFVPVLRDAASRSPAALVAGLERMKADVRTRSVPREELRGATITLSNFGMLGGLHASLVVVPPQVAILGAGRVHERVVPHAGQVAIRRALPLSLSFDHRAVAGGEAARFMVTTVQALESGDGARP